MDHDVETRTSHWVLGTLLSHIEDHFSGEAVELVRRTPVRFTASDEPLTGLADGLGLPTGMAIDWKAEALPVHVRGVRILLPHRLPMNGQEASTTQGWLRALGGALVPAWNLMGACRDLLTAASETQSRDAHGRARTDLSERVLSGRHRSPTVNDAAYLLVLGAAAQAGLSARWVEEQVLPPVIHLSHDCDNLRDSNFWLQASRLKRAVRSGGRWQPDGRPLRFAAQSALGLRNEHAGDLAGFSQLESSFGFWSRFYFLNGRGGRYGARSRDTVTFAAADSVEAPHEVGLHYNYHSSLSADSLRRQRSELAHATHRRIISGRAHYLRFEITESPRTWAAAGIRLDESIGYPDRCGFRVGLGGVFQPIGPDGRVLPIACIPLVAMDGAMAADNPDDPAGVACALLDRVALVGGAAGVLFHPGHLANDEFPLLKGAYDEVLQHAHRMGARQQTTADILARRGIAVERDPLDDDCPKHG